MLRFRPPSCFVVLLLCLVPLAARAQAVRPPARSVPIRPAIGANQLEQELVVEGDLFGGYDDNLTLVGGDPFAQHPGGSLAYGEADLRYSLQKRDRGFDVSGRGFWNAYQNVGVTPTYGGEQRAHGHLKLGRKTAFEVNEGFRSSPYFTLGAFGSLSGVPGISVPDSNPINGLVETRSRAFDATGLVRQELTRRLKMTASYAFNDTRYPEGAFSNNRSNLGSVVVERMVGRWGGVSGSYLSIAQYLLRSAWCS